MKCIGLFAFTGMQNREVCWENPINLAFRSIFSYKTIRFALSYLVGTCRLLFLTNLCEESYAIIRFVHVIVGLVKSASSNDGPTSIKGGSDDVPTFSNSRFLPLHYYYSYLVG
jgi:hypothetical protein